MTFSNTRQNQKRARVPSKAEAFAKAWRNLKPQDLWLQYDERLGSGRNPHGKTFGVNREGKLTIEDAQFSPKDALRLAAWIMENFG